MSGESTSLKVVAFDPGITTGYAMGDISQAGKMTVVTGEKVWKENDLLLQLEWYKPDIIVYERFDFRRSSKYQRDKVELYSRNLIGVIELYGQQHPEVKLDTQSASQAMGYYTDRKLKQDLIYKPNKPHANDAARHLLHWFTFGPGYKWNTQGYETGGR